MMRLTIAGVHMDTGDAIRAHTEARLGELEQHFNQMQAVTATFVHEPHHHHIHIAELSVTGSGLLLRAEGQGVDFYGAIDDAIAKLKRQLEKYKGKIESHHARRRDQKGAIAGDLMAFEEAEVVADATDGAVPDGVFAAFAPDIVKKEVSQLAPMTVDEAVMQMDLLHKPAFLFMNTATNQLNMVYREGGNRIRWVAPKVAA